MTSIVLDQPAQEKKTGFLSSLFNKLTEPLREWFIDLQEQYEDAKIHVETGVMPDREFTKDQRQEQRIKHIVRNVYFRDLVENSPQGLRASIAEFHKDNGGGFDIEEVAKHAESIPIEEREKITPNYLKNPETQEDIDYKNEIAERETRHTEQANKWDILNDSVGGDLFENETKLSIMRKYDSEENLSWEEFSEKVTTEINQLNKASLNIEEFNP